MRGQSTGRGSCEAQGLIVRLLGAARGTPRAAPQYKKTVARSIQVAQNNSQNCKSLGTQKTIITSVLIAILQKQLSNYTGAARYPIGSIGTPRQEVD